MTLQDELEHKEQWKKLSQKELDEILDKHENFATGQRDQAREHVVSSLEAAPGFRPAQKLLLELADSQKGQ